MGTWLVAMTHESCGDAMLRQVKAVCDLGVQHMFVNIYKPRSVPCRVPEVPCSITMFDVHGMKGTSGKHALTPERVQGFDHMWILDSDIMPGHLNLSLIASRNVNVSQPSVVVNNVSRGSDHRHLNHRKTCAVARTSLVEVMTPMFKRAAWVHFHNTILNHLSDAHLCSVWGLDFAWSVLNSDTSVFYDQTIVHLNTHQMKRHNATQCPTVRSPHASSYIHDRWFKKAPRFTRLYYHRVTCLTRP